MATKDLLVRILGDSRDLERSFATSSTAARRFENQTTSSLGRVDKGLTKLQKVAAGGFIGGVAFSATVRGLRTVIAAAEESEQVLGQTRVALESTGKSWAQYGDTIEDAIASQSKLGFDDEALLRTFSLFIRTSDDVGEAIRRNAISMNLARARFIELEQAANLVNKAALGQAGALRRVGIDARNGATGVELLAQLEREFAGAAVDASNSATGATDRMAVSIENAQEAIGTLLLPAVESFADATAEAVDVVTQLIGVLGKLGSVEIPTIEIPFTTKEVGGGTFGGAAGKVAGLGVLGAISPAALFAVGIKEAIDRIRGEQPPSADINRLAGEFDSQFSSFTDQAVAKVNESVAKTNSRIKGFGQKGFKPIDVNPLGEELQNQFENSLAALDLEFDQAEFRGNSEQALKVLADIEATVRRRIATQGRTNELMRQLFEVERQREGILDANRDAAAATAKAAKDLAAQQAATARETQRAIREAAKAQKQADEFRALGLSRTGDEIVPGVANLQKRVAGALRRISSGELDAGTKVVDRLKLARKLLKKEGKGLEEDTRRVINDLLSTLKQGADKLESGPLTKTTSLSGNRLLAGLGLSPEQERELRQRVAGFNSAGKALTGRTSRPARFDGAAPVVVESHTTVNLDGETVGRNVTRQQQKRARRNPVQKRGPNSGI